MKNSYTICLLLLCIPLKCFSQHSISGTVQSDSEKIPYALLHLKQSNLTVYTDSLGKFKLDNINANETLTINCMGFEEKKINLNHQKSPLVIELQKNSTVLDEMVIYKYNRSEWKSFFKKPKPHKWRNSISIFEGNAVIVQYKATKDIKFNGIAFITRNNVKGYENKKLRPLIFKDSISAHTSLINNEIHNFYIPQNAMNEQRKVENKTKFEFDHVIEIKEGEIFYVGIELVPNKNEVTSERINNHLILACIREVKSPSLQTIIYTQMFQPATDKDSLLLLDPKDLYFELHLLE